MGVCDGGTFLLYRSSGKSLANWKLGQITVLRHCDGNGEKFCQREIFSTESGEVLTQASRAALSAPSLEVFMARLNGAMGNIIKWMATLPRAWDWNLVFEIPSTQPIL